MVEAQGSIGQRVDGNVGALATDSAVEESPEVGAFAKRTGRRRLRREKVSEVRANDEREPVAVTRLGLLPRGKLRRVGTTRRAIARRPLRPSFATVEGARRRMHET